MISEKSSDYRQQMREILLLCDLPKNILTDNNIVFCKYILIQLDNIILGNKSDQFIHQNISQQYLEALNTNLTITVYLQAIYS